MLFAEIDDKEKSKLAFELGINLGIFRATMKREQIQAEETQYSKLNLILKSLEKQNQIGTVESSKPYFKATANMCWGEFPDTGLIYFTGEEQDNIFGLGGSLKHVIGYQNIKELQEKTGSRVAGIEKSLIEKLGLEPLRKDLISDINELKKPKIDLQSIIEQTHERLTGGESGKVDFVARRLYQDSENAPKIVLGTPIYVCYAD
jgi:hypothetical protein